MQRIDVDELKPSMVLAATIKDPIGNVIFLRGAQLTEKHITILKNRNIKIVSVEGDRTDKGAGLTEAQDAEIERRFSTAGTHSVVLKIKETLKGLLS